MLKLKIKLKEIMKERRITQVQLSEMTGIAQARISTLMKPNRQEINLGTLEKISHALGITDVSLLLQFEQDDTEG